MARASRWGSTGLDVFGLTAASIEAIIDVDEGVDIKWVGFLTGALWAPCRWRRLIYTVPSPPCERVGGLRGGSAGRRKTRLTLVGLADGR